MESVGPFAVNVEKVAESGEILGLNAIVKVTL